MLKIENIKASYGHVRVLSDVSLKLKEKEIVTLIGSNGAGKTTLLKAVSGLLKVEAGRIEFEGERIDRLPPERIIEKGIAHCPEGRRVFSELSVWENLEMGAYREKSKKVVRERIEEMVSTFPILMKRRKQMAGTLSGGEQQQLAIARSLMSNPKLVLFDEPSLGLAPILVEQVLEIIAALKSKGITILLVEQNANMALRVADYAYVLETGRVILEGAAAELCQDEKVITAYLGGACARRTPVHEQ
jgi:branched-chain amino acid transport system ATP-binding protein